MRSSLPKSIWWVPILVVIISGGAYFYYYNYVQHTKNARTLRLPGFREFVCKGVALDRVTATCGGRAIYGDADWGVTAYFSIYGVQSRDESEEIARYMVEARRKSNQEDIPMHVEIYSSPRSEGSRPTSKKIFEKQM